MSLALVSMVTMSFYSNHDGKLCRLLLTHILLLNIADDIIRRRIRKLVYV